jgi:hypothetical protein
VAGFLQILTSESLEILEEYCNQSLDLRSTEHAAKQKMIKEEMPALWPNLIEILNLENANYLPGDVSSIILKMIHIRRNTFLHSATRSSDDYIEGLQTFDTAVLEFNFQNSFVSFDPKNNPDFCLRKGCNECL